MTWSSDLTEMKRTSYYYQTGLSETSRPMDHKSQTIFISCKPMLLRFHVMLCINFITDQISEEHIRSLFGDVLTFIMGVSPFLFEYFIDYLSEGKGEDQSNICSFPVYIVNSKWSFNAAPSIHHWLFLPSQKIVQADWLLLNSIEQASFILTHLLLTFIFIFIWYQCTLSIFNHWKFYRSSMKRCTPFIAYLFYSRFSTQRKFQWPQPSACNYNTVWQSFIYIFHSPAQRQPAHIV